MQSKDIIAYARETLGTPYAHQGRLCGMALDCAGVAAYVAGRLNVKFNDRPGYSRLPVDGLLESVMDDQPCLVRVYDKQPGDILVMRFMGDPQHLAIYTGDTIIHAYEGTGRVVEHRIDNAWEKRIVRVYRFKDMAGS